MSSHITYLLSIPVVAVDDVEDDEAGGIDETNDSEARHCDEQRQWRAVHFISLIDSR